MAIQALELFSRRVEVDPCKLVDVSTLKPDQNGLEVLAGLWAWTEAMALEDERMIYTFTHIAVQAGTVKQLVGDEVWNAIFGTCAVTQDTPLPAQLRQLMAYQLRKLAARLQSTELDAVREEAATAAKSKKKVIAKHTDKLRKAAGKKSMTKMNTD